MPQPTDPLRQKRREIIRANYAICQQCNRYKPYNDGMGCHELPKPCQLLDNLMCQEFECPLQKFSSIRTQVTSQS